VQGQLSRFVFGRCSVRISVGTTAAILNEDFRGLPWSNQANDAIVPGIGHDCFLPNPFQFIIHNSFYHSMLCSRKNSQSRHMKHKESEFSKTT
jgi:hypothetical protein